MLWNCYGVQKDHWLLGERSDGFWNRKAEPCDLPCSGRPVMHLGLEMLKHADALVHEDHCFTTNSRCSVFQTAKEVLVTFFKILFECVFEVGSLESHIWTPNSEKRHFLWVICMFWSWGRDLLIPDCYITWNLGPSFWAGEKKAVHGMAPSSFSMENLIHKVSVSGEGHGHCLVGWWRSDSYWCDDVTRGWQNSEEFQMSSTLQESNRCASTW
jgi:hypothetical protein